MNKAEESRNTIQAHVEMICIGLVAVLVRANALGLQLMLFHSHNHGQHSPAAGPVAASIVWNRLRNVIYTWPPRSELQPRSKQMTVLRVPRGGSVLDTQFPRRLSAPCLHRSIRRVPGIPRLCHKRIPSGDNLFIRQLETKGGWVDTNLRQKLTLSHEPRATTRPGRLPLCLCLTASHTTATQCATPRLPSILLPVWSQPRALGLGHFTAHSLMPRFCVKAHAVPLGLGIRAAEGKWKVMQVQSVHCCSGFSTRRLLSDLDGQH